MSCSKRETQQQRRCPSRWNFLQRCHILPKHSAAWRFKHKMNRWKRAEVQAPRISRYQGRWGDSYALPRPHWQASDIMFIAHVPSGVVWFEQEILEKLCKKIWKWHVYKEIMESFEKRGRRLMKLPLSAVDMFVSCVFCRLVLMGKRNDRGREIIHTAPGASWMRRKVLCPPMAR